MLQIDHVSKRFDRDGQAVEALDQISLKVGAGEILALLGPSGCGKSTLLRIVAGLEQASQGRVLLDGTPVTAPRSDVGVVFQEPRLMPWLSVADNVAFGLDHLPKSERQRLVAAALERVGLAGFAGAVPKQLSGGMAQRAGLARALVTRPGVLLLDEPFSALDAFTRASLQDHLLDIWADSRPTMLFVTHDIEEALILADRVALMLPRPGRVLRDERIELPRPRRRADPWLQRAKERLLDDLRHVAEPARPPDNVRTLSVKARH